MLLGTNLERFMGSRSSHGVFPIDGEIRTLRGRLEKGACGARGRPTLKQPASPSCWVCGLIGARPKRDGHKMENGGKQGKQGTHVQL